MPLPPKYRYEPAHADSIAALSRLGRPPSGGAQTVGVFRFRGSKPVRIDRLDDDTFVAIRLDAGGGPRRLVDRWIDRLLDVVRSLFRLEGGARWTLSQRDCREMESWMFALSARAMQQEVRCQRERAAMRDRRDAGTLSRLEALPLSLLHAISARLSPQDCHALRQVCSRFAKPMAHCVPLLHATSWMTLAGLRRAVAHVLAKAADAPFAVPPGSIDAQRGTGTGGRPHFGAGSQRAWRGPAHRTRCDSSGVSRRRRRCGAAARARRPAGATGMYRPRRKTGHPAPGARTLSRAGTPATGGSGRRGTPAEQEPDAVDYRPRALDAGARLVLGAGRARGAGGRAAPCHRWPDRPACPVVPLVAVEGSADGHAGPAACRTRSRGQRPCARGTVAEIVASHADARLRARCARRGKRRPPRTWRYGST
ncbi:hypothetical protein OJJOAM_001635 [Cupriavidus sp. H18C1]